MDPSLNRDSLPDAKLLCRFHDEGDHAALSLLVERHRALAYRVALGVLRNADDAQDATQNAFLSLLALDPRRCAPGSLAGLIARLALRAAQRLARGNARRQARELAVASPESTGPDQVFAAVADRVLSRSVRQMVQSLSDSYRLPVQLHYFEGLSTRETAEALGISQTAVTTRLSRAVSRLRRHLAAEGCCLTVAALIALLDERPAGAAPVPGALVSRLQELAVTARPAPCAAGSAPTVAGIGLAHAQLAGIGLAVVVAVGGIGALQHLASSAPRRAANARSAETRPSRILPDPGRVAGGTWRPPGAAVGPHVVARPAPKGKGGVTGQRGPDAAGLQTVPPVAQSGDRPHQDLPIHPHAPLSPRARTAGQAHPHSHNEPVAAPAASGIKAGEERNPPRGELSAAEQRAVAAEILWEAWREAEKVEYAGRYDLLIPLGIADPDRAEDLARNTPAQLRQFAEEKVAVGLLQHDMPRALHFIERPQSSHGLLIEGVRYLAPPVRGSDTWRRTPVDEARARALLTSAIEKPNTLDRPWRVAYHIADAAGYARRLGHPRAEALTAQAIALAPAAVDDLLRMWQGDPQPAAWREPDARERGMATRHIASHVAHADLDAALALVEQIRDEAEKVSAGLHVAMEAIAQDPGRARALAESLRPAPVPHAGPAWYTWSNWAARFAGSLAGDDAGGALAFARRIPVPADRAVALATVARALPADQAAPVCREALAAARQIEQTHALAYVARVAEAAPVGPDRRNACTTLLELAANGTERGPVWAEPVAAVAFALAPVDPQGARALLEELLAAVAAGPAADEARETVAVAFAALDPRRGAEIARTIPLTSPRHRFGALAQIANYLVATPEERRPACFRFWLSGYRVGQDTFQW